MDNRKAGKTTAVPNLILSILGISVDNDK